MTGGAVNAAARLQQAAAPDEILVGALTRTLVEGGVRFAPARNIDAKGLGTLEAFSAEALLTALPEQHRGLGELRAPLIGRDAELRLLRESYGKAEHERAAYLVTVFGQAGVGKSRLVSEFVEIVGRQHVLRGRCLPYGSGITYWPLYEMLRADVAIEADDTRDEATRKLHTGVFAAFDGASADAETVARRVAVLAGLATVEEALPGIAAEGVGEELRWAVRRYFEQRAQETPLALIFDDIHWAEEPLLKMIEHLSEWSRAPLFVLCLARPELHDRRPSWGGGLMNAAAVRLEPLNEAETRRLIGALLALDDLPESLRATIVARAQGNPLYVEELLRMVIDAGHIERRDGRFMAVQDIGELALPATLHALIAARLDQLPPEVKRVLQRAAVVGEVFYTDALNALGPSDGHLENLVLFAARRDFVVERDERGPGGGRTHQFKHILIRDVAYGSLPKDERSRLHDALSRWLETTTGERRDEFVAIVAYHAEQAYRLAKELRETDADALGRRALDLLLAAARIARRGGDPRASYELDRGASDIAEAINATLAERAEARGFAALAREELEGWKSARDELAAALALAREAGPSEILVHLLLDQAGSTVDGSRANAREAVATARRYGDPDLIALALIVSAWPPWVIGDLDESLRILTDAREYIRSSGAQRMLLECLRWLRNNAWQRGDFTRFIEIEQERIDAASKHESKLLRVLVPAQSAYWLASVSGNWADAIAGARRLVAIAEEFGAESSGFNTQEGWPAKERLARALYDADKFDDAVAALLEIVHTREATSLSTWIGDSRQALARAQLAVGDLASAHASAERAYREIAASDVTGRTTAATALAMVRAVEGNVADSDRLHREAVADIERTGYQFLATETRQAYAEFLLAQGRAAEARPLLEKVRDFYGHPFVARRRERAEELLRRCDEVRA